MSRKRLTKQVKQGLLAMASMVEAGPFTSADGDLAEQADEVDAAIAWIWSAVK